MVIRISFDASGPIRAIERIKAVIASPAFAHRVLEDEGLISAGLSKRYCDEVRLNDTGDYKRSIQFTVLDEQKQVRIHDGVNYGVYLEFGTRKHPVYLWKKGTTRSSKNDLTGMGRWMLRKARVPWARLRSMWRVEVSTPEYRPLLVGLYRSLPVWRSKIAKRFREACRMEGLR